MLRLLLAAGTLALVPAALAGIPPRAAAGPAAGDVRLLVDLERGGEAELALLPGVGPGLARRIREERDSGGPFGSAEAVARRVRGVGAATAATWDGWVGGTPAPGAPRAPRR